MEINDDQETFHKDPDNNNAGFNIAEFLYKAGRFHLKPVRQKP